jgi:hypothetical protein
VYRCCVSIMLFRERCRKKCLYGETLIRFLSLLYSHFPILNEYILEITKADLRVCLCSLLLCINLGGREAKIHAWGPASLSNMEAFSRYTRRVLLLCLAKRILRLQRSLRAVPRIVKLLPFLGTI